MKRSVYAALLFAFLFTICSAVPIDPEPSNPPAAAAQHKFQLSKKQLRKMSEADMERIMGREMSEAEKTAFSSGKRKFAEATQMVEVKKTNTLAILALVGGALLGPVGIVLGIIALGQIKKRNEAGRGWAIAGIVLGSIWTFWVLLSAAAWGGWGG